MFGKEFIFSFLGEGCFEDEVLWFFLLGKRGGTFRRLGARNSVGLVGVEGVLFLF